MSNDNPSIISHLSIGTNDFIRAKSFYDAVLPSLGIGIVMEHPDAVAYGKQYPEFWVQVPITGKPASVGNGFHVGFFANDKEEVDAFQQAAIAAGVTCDAPLGARPIYGDPYNGCYVRHHVGHKID